MLALTAPASGEPVTANEAVDIDTLYRERTFIPPHRQRSDPLADSIHGEMPTRPARGRILGTGADLLSLAAKLHLLDNARHTIDMAYYIFERDLVGYAVLGALCQAVQRGVDVRLVIDSIGSLHASHAELKALSTCADQAGEMRTPSGRPSGHRARVQVVVFNAVSNLSGRLRAMTRNVANWFRRDDLPRISIRVNRRLHDKLLVVDGDFADRAAVVIGGRNIASQYHGMHDDGSHDPDAYRDVELLLRPATGIVDGVADEHLGTDTARYFQALFLHLGNKPLQARTLPRGLGVYRRERRRFEEHLARVRALPGYAAAARGIDAALDRGLAPARVTLAHELANLTNRDAVTRAYANMIANPNSIMHRMRRWRAAPDVERIRMVSPYLFFDRFPPRDPDPVIDEVRAMRQWVEAEPNRRIEIITNSVLTTDNALAQAIIDMQMAPRLLLDDTLKTRWQESLWGGRIDRELVDSEAWRRAVNNPKIRFYESGRLDSRPLRGNGIEDGRLHAKFITADGGGFVGTTNFDHRSRILNNESGFFYHSPALSRQLDEEFEALRQRAYLWGSPEWLKMREAMLEHGGAIGLSTRWQRAIFGFLHGFYLAWLI